MTVFIPQFREQTLKWRTSRTGRNLERRRKRGWRSRRRWRRRGKRRRSFFFEEEKLTNTDPI